MYSDVSSQRLESAEYQAGYIHMTKQAQGLRYMNWGVSLEI
jgi:hypothetical protein